MKKVPKLRFKEFTGEWEEKKIENIGKISMCKRIMKNQTTIKGEIPFYKIGTFGKEADAYIEEKLFNEYKEKYSFPKKGEILLSASGTIGRTVKYDGKPAYFQDSNIVWVANDEKLVLNSFLYNLYANIKWLTEDTTIARLYNNNLANIIINIPNLQEQEKIANFLSSVDKKISLTEEKLELFKNYKKGIMQKIFSQKLRFKDENGNDYPEWEEIEIGKILTERKEYSEKNENYPHFSLTKDGVLPKSERYERDFLVKDDEKMYKITHLNDICYNPANLKFGVICKNNLGSGIFSPIYITFIVHKGVNANYLDLYIKYSDFIKRARKYEEGTVYERMAVKCSDFIKVKVNLPCLEEQEKIANFLSSIDEKIEKIENEVENLKEFKKGLLQRLFV